MSSHITVIETGHGVESTPKKTSEVGKFPVYLRVKKQVLLTYTSSRKLNRGEYFPKDSRKTSVL